MKLWENWKITGVLGLISVITCFFVFWQTGELPRHRGLSAPEPEPIKSSKKVKRAVGSGGDDGCLKASGGVEFGYVNGSTTAFTFDLCEVIKCSGDGNSWRTYNVWVCYHPMMCYPKSVWGPSWDSDIYTYVTDQWCSWQDVVAWTGVGWQPTVPPALEGIAIQRDYSVTNNPITLSLGPWSELPEPGFDGGAFYLVVGVDKVGTDPFGLIRVNLFNPRSKPLGNDSALNLTVQTDPVETVTYEDPEEKWFVATDYTRLKPQELIERATGFGDRNLWLDWVAQNAKEQKVVDCVACATARPHLFTEPAPLYPEDEWGYNCMLRLTREAVDTGNCTTLSGLYPPIDKRTQPGSFTPKRDNYTCFEFSTDRVRFRLGRINPSWCQRTITGRTTNDVSDPSTIIGTWARGGLYYYCGEYTLLVQVPLGSVGTCALVRLAAPLMLIGSRLETIPQQGANVSTARRRRATGAIHKYDPRRDSPTWIDSIGVPRGVPDEYKLVDQIAAGFESVFLWVTPNKNVDRINYVHYNGLRLSNLTRDAVEGLAEQLGPTSLMGIQNRMALDMLLAEKGGVCAMFGDLCCTFIPNNTAPDGTVTRALENLKTLSRTMHEQSGVNSRLGDWFTSVFGQYKGLFISAMFSLLVFLGLLLIGCCLIPLVRQVLGNLVSRAIASGSAGSAGPEHMMPLREAAWTEE
uniref:Uncharacterized protein n=1 Tax=Astatotilapia calliptera TaxID=8154 RepID=A0AAX7V1G1_ASTCA